MVMNVLKSKKAAAKRNIFSAINPQKYNSQDIQQKIETKAYELFEQRGCGHGNDLNDWLEAESIILAELGQAKR